MADITRKLPEEISALLYTAGLTVRSVQREFSSEHHDRVLAYKGRYVADVPVGLKTLDDWQRWLSNVMPS